MAGGRTAHVCAKRCDASEPPGHESPSTSSVARVTGTCEDTQARCGCEYGSLMRESPNEVHGATSLLCQAQAGPEVPTEFVSDHPIMAHSLLSVPRSPGRI